MVKRLLIVIFLMTQPVAAECKYYAEADVVNDVLVNKKEHYTCKEKESFFIRFETPSGPKPSIIFKSKNFHKNNPNLFDGFTITKS